MTKTAERLQVGINIDVTPGVAGGIAQSTQGLVSSLGRLNGPEEYVLIAQTSDQADWIRQYCGPSQRVVLRTPVARRTDSALKRLVRPAFSTLREWMGRLTPPREWRETPLSDGYYESLGCDVLHFPTQSYALCALPTVYNPHDLQHLHYPQFWTASDLAFRETLYRDACHFSHTVVVGSEWIKQDVLRQYRLSPDKVQIIPWAPPTEQYPEVTTAQIEDARRRFDLPAAFAFYPAVCWPHKNHLRLLQALARLRDSKGVVVNLVCTGSKYASHWPKIEQSLQELKLESQVKFLGFVSETDLRSLYRLAQFLVLPTLFEADSCPIHEAWTEGLAVASSNHTALPDQVGDAGLLFDAAQVDAIAAAVHRMTTEPDLRKELVERGHRRVKDFDWARTAQAFRAVYRRAAGTTLNEEDRWLLQWDWMREPGRKPPAQQG